MLNPDHQVMNPDHQVMKEVPAWTSTSHQRHLMALDQTKVELYDLELDLYAQIYHVQVDAPWGHYTLTTRS